jgi:D-methionine transport system ATP-binding protein
LPDNGINIEILRREKSSNNSILSEMAIATQTVFSIVLGSLDHYQDDIKGSIVINVQTEDREKIINYLNMHNIEWRKF